MHNPVVLELLEARRLFASVAIDLQETQQTLVALGGNFARAKYGDIQIESNDKVGKYLLDKINPRHARVGIPLRGWEPTNDNSNPNSINANGFATSNTTINGVLQLMQDLNNRGIPITGSVWDAPNWMISDPTKKNQRIVSSSKYPELVESIAAFLKRADEVFGVRIDYLSFNEADGGYNLRFTSSQHASIIKLASAKFAELGLSYTPKWLVGDTGNAQRLINYVTPILNDPDAAPYLGPISFHGWDCLKYADSIFTDIAALGQQYGKPIWCEEVGYDAGAFSKDPPPFPTWDYAIKLSQAYYKVMKLAQVTVADYWQMQNDYPLLAINGSTVTHYPAYYIVQALHHHFTPGMQMVTADSDTAGVLSMAAKDDASGRVSVHLINTTSQAQTVTLNGLPDGSPMSLSRSTATENLVKAGTYTVNGGTITVSLPAMSVSTISGSRPPQRSPVIPPAPPAPAPPPAPPLAPAPPSFGIVSQPRLERTPVHELFPEMSLVTRVLANNPLDAAIPVLLLRL